MPKPLAEKNPVDSFTLKQIEKFNREVFLTDKKIPDTKRAPFQSPCEACSTRDCQTACAPRAAGQSFSLSACAGYRFSDNSACQYQCLARFACPVGQEHRYSDEQMQYHMGELLIS
jgi:hypothetical protein